jgi:hypothetical protein
MSSQPPAGEPHEDLDFVVPTPPPAVGIRSSTISTAGAALAIAGLFTVAGTALVAGAGGSDLTVALVGALGVIQLVVAVLVFRQVSIGRPAGLVVAAVGFFLGLVRLIDGTGVALLDLAVYSFVIWALATNREAFERG